MALSPARPALVLPVDALSIARLHGEACIYCGSTTPPFADAGYIDTKSGDGTIAWRVVSCSEHTDGAGTMSVPLRLRRHPDDLALLDAADWAPGDCLVCGPHLMTTEAGAHRVCRDHGHALLVFARAAASDSGHADSYQPSLAAIAAPAA